MINYHLYSVVKLSFKTNTCFSDDQFYYTNITKLQLPIIKKKITKFVFLLWEIHHYIEVYDLNIKIIYQFPWNHKYMYLKLSSFSMLACCDKGLSWLFPSSQTMGLNPQAFSPNERENGWESPVGYRRWAIPWPPHLPNNHAALM